MTTGTLAMLAMLVGAQPVPAGGRADAVRRELSEVAARIEQMKAAGVRGGVEIEALLARSQGLASELEQLERRTVRATPAAEGGDPQELRERADALRDEVDRLRTALEDVDRRLRDEGRRRRAGRLARMEEEGALFSEASPGRVGTPRSAGGTSDTGAPSPEPSAPAGPSESGLPGSPPPVAPADVQPTAPSAPTPATPNAPTAPTSETPPSVTDGGSAAGASPAHVWSSPGASRPWAERLTPGRGEDAPEQLRRERQAILDAIGDAQERILHLEAEARELDHRP